MIATAPHSPPTAFVTGGSGFVGSRLISRLLQTGWTVRALARSPEAIRAVQTLGAVPIPGGLDDRVALRAGLKGCDVAFHVAAHFKFWGPRATFDRVNVEGTRALVDIAAETSSVRRVVAVSAAGVVMGDPVPMLGVDETTPLQTRAFAPYSSSKADGERVLLAANGRRPGFETLAIRPPFIWGAGMPALAHMVERVQAGRWQWVGSGAQPMSTCHVDNLCDALLLAADRGRGGQAYFVSDGEDGTLKTVLSGLLATRGLVAPDRAAPFLAAWVMAGLIETSWRALRLRGEPPLTRQMLRLVGKPFTIRIDKARRELGYAPQVTWERGIAAMSAGGGRERSMGGAAEPNLAGV